MENAKERILRFLEQRNRPAAVHEINLFGISQNNIATRLSELALEKKVGSYYPVENGKKCHYKVWYKTGTQAEMFQDGI